MRRAGNKLSYHNFFRQQACVSLPTMHAEPFDEYSTTFSELQWTLEIVVGPYSWGPGDVLRSAYSQTKSFQAGAEICFGGEEGGEALGRLCTVEDFVDPEATCVAIWTRWTVRRTDGKATSLYDDMPTEDADLNLIKEEMSAGKSATVFIFHPFVSAGTATGSMALRTCIRTQASRSPSSTGGWSLKRRS